MSGNWKDCSKRQPCQICGRGGWCGYTDDGAHRCMKSHGAEVPGWTKLSEDDHGGTVYRAKGDERGKLTPESERAKKTRLEAEAAERRAKTAQAWQDWWSRARPDHTVAIDYVQQRGVPLEHLPGKRLPTAVRGIDARTDKTRGDDGEWTETHGPVVVAGVVSREGRFQACQRIFLTKEGRKRSKECKLAAGPLAGGACRLGNDYTSGTLILCEGVETGLALLAAGHVAGMWGAVWACISTSGLRNVEIPPELLYGPGAPLAGGRIIIAGDFDRVDTFGRRPGGFAAESAAVRLRQMCKGAVGGVTVAISMPMHEDVPKLIDEGGELVEGEKTADWLDVWNHWHGRNAAEKVARGVLRCPPTPTAEGDQAGPSIEDVEDNGYAGVPAELVISENHLERARRALVELFSPTSPGPHGGLRIRRYMDLWWLHDGTRYAEISEESVRARVRPWINRFLHRHRGKTVALNPAEKTIGEVLASMTTDILIEPQFMPRMPGWLGEDFNAAGGALPRALEQRVLRTNDVRVKGLPEATELIAFSNGLLDIRAWVRGEVRLLPHSELYFSQIALPYEFPVELLKEKGVGGEALDDLIGELAPVWMKFLESASDGDDEWVQALAQFFGYCLTPWTTYEIIMVLSGAPRAGKGVILEALKRLIGEHQICSSNINLLTERFFPSTLIGKALCVLPDADVGRQTDAIRATEVLKSLASGDPLYADRKNKEPIAAFVPNCKVCILCNRMIKLPDPSGALLGRLRVLQFEISHLGRENREFKSPAVMEREAVGRMIWALKGLRLLVARDGVTQPKAGEQLLAEYAEYSDPAGKFRDECLTTELVERQDGTKRAAWRATDELYKTYRAWCMKSGREARNKELFVIDLRAAMPSIRRVRRSPCECDGGLVVTDQARPGRCVCDLCSKGYSEAPAERWGYEGIGIDADAVHAAGDGSPDPTFGVNR